MLAWDTTTQHKFFPYRDNIQELCDKMGIRNPIREEDLQIKTLVFSHPRQAKDDDVELPVTYRVEGGEMNCAGRLFMQSMEQLRHSSAISGKMRTEAETYFTSALWDDCSLNKRPLVFGMKMYKHVVVIFKPGTFDKK